MASPPSPRQEPRSPLPAPYEDPWRRLANDLVAVVAAAGLKSRELWRLNGEGSLATPAFWPSSLAPVFWPLLLALGLALLVGLGLWLPGAASRVAGPQPIPRCAPGRSTPGGGRCQCGAAVHHRGDTAGPRLGWGSLWASQLHGSRHWRRWPSEPLALEAGPWRRPGRWGGRQA